MLFRINKLIILKLAALFCLIFMNPVSADESRPGSLQILEIQSRIFDVTWRMPITGSQVVSLTPIFPQHCVMQGNRSSIIRSGASVERWRVDCGKEGLEGYPLKIDGLEKTYTDALVQISFINGISHNQLVSARKSGFIVAESPSALQVAWDYFVLGVEHILSGFDHLLFVFCLVLLVSGLGNLVRTITAFTLAHSFTLAGSVLGYINVSQGPVEAVIALSILFLARELVIANEFEPKYSSGPKESLTVRSPWLVAFAFGLLHGFGFAGALNEIGLPQTEIPLALLMFNVGVEAGQLIFVLATLICKRLIRLLAIPVPRWGRTTMVYSIGGIAAFWMIDRVSGFWT